MKILEEFDFGQARVIPPTKIRALAEGGYIDSAETVVFNGECGTGKTHLMMDRCVSTRRQKRQLRFAIGRDATDSRNRSVSARSWDSTTKRGHGNSPGRR